MIIIYLLALFAALITYSLTVKLAIIVRLMIAFFVFCIPSALVTVWVFFIGDKAPPDAVIIHQNNEKQSSLESRDQ
jgi:hypothetical protein